MGKPSGKKKSPVASKPTDGNVKQSKASKAFDDDTAVFIGMSHDLKEEGNKLFQKRDHEGAMLKYEKALKLLPKNHTDVAHLRWNMASCYMQMGIGEYPRAINECNLALEVIPKYSKALLKRAKCYEALNKLELALGDVKSVLSVEPNNATALEYEDKLKKALVEMGVDVECKEKGLSPAIEEPSIAATPLANVFKDKIKKKKSNRIEKKSKLVEGNKVDEEEEKKAEDKVVVEEKMSIKEEKVATKTVKLVFEEDIRTAHIPVNCGILLVRDIVLDRFPGLKGVLIKYRDREGDLVTITTTAELRIAELLADTTGTLRLYIAEVSPDREPLYDGVSNEEEIHKVNSSSTPASASEMGKSRKMEEGLRCIEDWLIQFAVVFKNHIGFESDSYLDLHELGMKLHPEALEDSVTSEDAQELLDIAAATFQEMAALALFNWGNVHMNKARKLVFFEEDASAESTLAHIKSGYEWAQKEYVKAGKRFEDALKIKPDFFEGLIALGQQQFEQAKLCWYYAIGNQNNLEGEASSQVIELYNKAEDSMERGMQVWEEMEERRLNGLNISDKYKADLQKMGLDGLFKDISVDEAAEHAANLRSQIYILWGTLLYERSCVEFKLGLPSWEECLEVSVEKFELAGASSTDIGVMMKNHCSNGSALEGFGFKIDEIVQAWNEMYDVKRWQTGVPLFRLEPLFRRRVPKLHSILEHH